MFRRMTSLIGLVSLTLLCWLLSATPAAAQSQSDPVKAGTPYVLVFVSYDWSGIGSLYASYSWGAWLIERNSAAARGDGDYIGPHDLPAGSKRLTALAMLRRYGGGLDWPTSLRTMTPREEMSDLRKRVDSVVEQLLHQPAADHPNTELVAELTANLDKVRKRFALYAADSPMTAQQEADARFFLRKVQDATKLIDDQPKLTTSPSK